MYTLVLAVLVFAEKIRRKIFKCPNANFYFLFVILHLLTFNCKRKVLIYYFKLREGQTLPKIVINN